MRIRNKLVLAMMLGVGLLFIQIAAVSFFIRQLQLAVAFVSDAQTVIEADFVAAEVVAKLREGVKRLPSSYVARRDPSEADGSSELWNDLGSRLSFIRASEAAQKLDREVLAGLDRAFATAQEEHARTLSLLAGRPDLDQLIERAIATDKSLLSLANSLHTLALELRGQLQVAVARERQVHNRPLIAGAAIGGLAILLLLAFTWFYVDRHLVARLTGLSGSMLAISGGNLKAPLPPATGRDEIAEMAEALRTFRDTAVEVEEMSLRERQVVLDTIEYGVLILDPQLRVRMHNRELRDLWRLSEDDLRSRPSFVEVLQAIRGRGLHSVSDAEWPGYVERRVAEVQAGNAPPQEWHRPDGRVLQYQITALPDGGRMLTYFDLTHIKKVETELRDAKEQAESRTSELAHSLDELRNTQQRLVQTEKLASLGQLTAGIAHEIKNPLNFVNNFSALSAELLEELRELIADAPLDEKLQAQVTELSELLRGNLERIVQHGRRADSIVKNMLLHSREGSGEHQKTDINAVVEESLNLAYHGARAGEQGFNITLEKSLDPSAGEVDIYPQDITRVLLNLISNGFYATTKRLKEANGAPYEPVLSASTRNLGDRVEIRIRDNGTGVPADAKAKLFNPFFTTKPAGEGTGLGLSISHDIIVKQHAGTIEVDTELGAFTEFRIILPRSFLSQRTSGAAA
jgi:signal transduction histidine kinase